MVVETISTRPYGAQIIGHCAPEGGKLATDDTRIGVLSFATSGDAELGEHDEELTIITAAGTILGGMKTPQSRAGLVGSVHRFRGHVRRRVTAS